MIGVITWLVAHVHKDTGGVGRHRRAVEFALMRLL